MPKPSPRAIDRLTLQIVDLYHQRLASVQAAAHGQPADDLLRRARRDWRIANMRHMFDGDAPHVHFLAGRSGTSLAEQDRWEIWAKQLHARGLRAGTPEGMEALEELMRKAGMLPEESA